MKANENAGGLDKLDKADFFDPQKQDSLEIDEILHSNVMDALMRTDNEISGPNVIAALSRMSMEELIDLSNKFEERAVFNDANPEKRLLLKEMVGEIKDLVVKAREFVKCNGQRVSGQRVNGQRVNGHQKPKPSRQGGKVRSSEISYSSSSRKAITEKVARRAAS